MCVRVTLRIIGCLFPNDRMFAPLASLFLSIYIYSNFKCCRGTETDFLSVPTKLRQSVGRELGLTPTPVSWLPLLEFRRLFQGFVRPCCSKGLAHSAGKRPSTNPIRCIAWNLLTLAWKHCGQTPLHTPVYLGVLNYVGSLRAKSSKLPGCWTEQEAIATVGAGSGRTEPARATQAKQTCRSLHT